MFISGLGMLRQTHYKSVLELRVVRINLKQIRINFGMFIIGLEAGECEHINIVED